MKLIYELFMLPFLALFGWSTVSTFIGTFIKPKFFWLLIPICLGSAFLAYEVGEMMVGTWYAN